MSYVAISPHGSVRRLKIQRWVSSLIIAGVWLGAGTANLVQNQSSMEVFRRLGYPDYFASVLGGAQVLGGLTVLLPLTRIPRTLKEWAYAGLTFDVVGAILSILATKGPPGYFVFPALALLAIAANYSEWKERSRAVDGEPLLSHPPDAHATR